MFWKTTLSGMCVQLIIVLPLYLSYWLISSVASGACVLIRRPTCLPGRCLDVWLWLGNSALAPHVQCTEVRIARKGATSERADILRGWRHAPRARACERIHPGCAHAVRGLLPCSLADKPFLTRALASIVSWGVYLYGFWKLKSPFAGQSQLWRSLHARTQTTYAWAHARAPGPPATNPCPCPSPRPRARARARARSAKVTQLGGLLPTAGPRDLWCLHLTRSMCARSLVLLCLPSTHLPRRVCSGRTARALPRGYRADWRRRRNLCRRAVRVRRRLYALQVPGLFCSQSVALSPGSGARFRVATVGVLARA